MPLAPFAPITARALRAALAALALAAAACDDDDPTGDEDEVEIESVRLTITAGGAPTVYTVTANGATPSPVQLRVGTSTIAAVPLDDNGQTVPEAAEFELVMSDLPAGVTFTRSGTLTATVSATAAAAARTARAEMFHRTENHTDYTANFQLSVVP